MNAIARVLAAYRKMIATPYDVPADHAYSRQSVAEQKLVQDAAAFIAEHTGKPVTVADNSVQGASKA